MRSLLIPAVLVACGLLAALPFRRSVDSSTSDGSASSNSVPAVAETVGLPDTVTPLRETPLAATRSLSADDRSLTKGRFATHADPAANPYTPALQNLPSSYQEVAVPLALPADPNNLLDANAAASRDTSESLRRFGIPGRLMAETAYMPNPAQVAENGWRPAQAIPSLEGKSALASVLESPPEPKPAAESPGPFQTVSETRTAAPHPAPQPATRERMFIREPS